MHILIGAVVGAVFAVAVTVGMSLLTGRKPVLKTVLLAALGGAVSGAVASATLGVGGVAAATTGRQVVAFAAGGAVGGGTERAAKNAVEGRPVHEDVLKASLVGGAAGTISLGTTRVSSAVMTKVFGPASVNAANAAARPTLLRRAIEAPTPGTGSGLVNFVDDRLENLIARDWIASAPTPRPGPRPATAPAPTPAGEQVPATKTPGMTGLLGGAF